MSEDSVHNQRLYLTKVKKNNLPLACGQLSVTGSPTPNPGGLSRIPGSSPWSQPPWVYRPPVSGRNLDCSSRSECGCPAHTRHKLILPRQSRAVATDRGCVRIGSCNCGAPLRIHQAGCSLSNTGETGSGSASRTGSCTGGTREQKKTS